MRQLESFDFNRLEWLLGEAVRNQEVLFGVFVVEEMLVRSDPNAAWASVARVLRNSGHMSRAAGDDAAALHDIDKLLRPLENAGFLMLARSLDTLSCWVLGRCCIYRAQQAQGRNRQDLESNRDRALKFLKEAQARASQEKRVMGIETGAGDLVTLAAITTAYETAMYLQYKERSPIVGGGGG